MTTNTCDGIVGMSWGSIRVGTRVQKLVWRETIPVTAMQAFKQVIALLLSTLALATALDWTGLRVRWASADDDPDHTNSFYALPRTKWEAVSQNWTKVKGVNPKRVEVFCYPEDARVCVLLDSHGCIAGLQMGMLVSDLANIQGFYNMSGIEEYKMKKIFGQEWWTTTTLFQHPDDIAKGGRTEQCDGLTGTGGVFFENGESYVEASRNRSDLVNIDYDWASMDACLEGMGTHTYFAMRESTPCSLLQPMFLQYENGILSGLGWMQFGNGSTVKERNWVESITSSLFKSAAATGPQCLWDWIDEWGLTAMHVYMGPEPWNISCD